MPRISSASPIMKPEFAKIYECPRTVKAGQITLNVTRAFGEGKLSELLFEVVAERFAVDNALKSCYDGGETEANNTQPALCSEFGGKL